MWPIPVSTEVCAHIAKCELAENKLVTSVTVPPKEKSENSQIQSQRKDKLLSHLLWSFPKTISYHPSNSQSGLQITVPFFSSEGLVFEPSDHGVVEPLVGWMAIRSMNFPKKPHY